MGGKKENLYIVSNCTKFKHTKIMKIKYFICEIKFRIFMTTHYMFLIADHDGIDHKLLKRRTSLPHSLSHSLFAYIPTLIH